MARSPIRVMLAPGELQDQGSIGEGVEGEVRVGFLYPDLWEVRMLTELIVSSVRRKL